MHWILSKMLTKSQEHQNVTLMKTCGKMSSCDSYTEHIALFCPLPESESKCKHLIEVGESDEDRHQNGPRRRENEAEEAVAQKVIRDLELRLRGLFPDFL